MIFSFAYYIFQLFILQQFDSNAEQFQADQLGHIYSVEGTKIEKLDYSGNTIFKNSSLDYGEFSSIDLTNPFQPFVFFKEQGKLAVLDNTLSLQGDVIDFFEKGYGNIECVGGSRGDAYWLWDVNKTELIKIDRQFNVVLSSGNLSLLLNKKITPIQILERGNNVFVADPNLGLLVFDIYGNYRNTIAITFEGNVCIQDEVLMFISQEKIYISDLKGLSIESLDLPVSTIEDWDLVYPNIIFLHEGKLSIYRIQA